MILPIYAYGHPVLKKIGMKIDRDFPGLEELISNMWQTMYNASGVGLAGPQVGQPIKMFIVDTEQMYEEEDQGRGIKQVFINAEMIEETGMEWEYEEGCLSIPKISAKVSRKPNIKIRFFDENFKEYNEEFDGLEARVIQHEYDHTKGVLFTEKIKPVKKAMLKRKLEQIKKGKANADYRMKFV